MADIEINNEEPENKDDFVEERNLDDNNLEIDKVQSENENENLFSNEELENNQDSPENPEENNENLIEIAENQNLEQNELEDIGEKEIDNNNVVEIEKHSENDDNTPKEDETEKESDESKDESREETIEIFIRNIFDSILDNIIKEKSDKEEKEEEEEVEDLKVDESEDQPSDVFIEHREVGRIEETAEPEEIIEYFDQNFDQIEDENQEYFEENKETEEIFNDEEDIKLTRDELLENLKIANIEEKFLLETNTSLQHKIGNFLRKKKVEQTSAGIAEEKGIIDFDQKYNKQMDTLKELINQYVDENKESKSKIEELENETKNREDKVKEDKKKFESYRFAISQKSINTRTGKVLSPKEIETISFNEEKKEIQVVETRLISIKLQNEVNKIDSILKSKEELADGLHLIDFEQFKIENQSYNEKLEERTEDLMKLRKKITSNVHILTHVKEKLEFVKYECDLEQDILKETEEKLSNSRDKLTSLKQYRDKLRSSNQKLKKSCGMLGNQDLLRNYEDCVDTVDVQKEKMNEMKNNQIKLTLRNQALQMKIENTRLGSSNG